MIEFKRVLFQKKYIVILLGLFAFNMIMFQYSQTDVMEILKDEVRSSRFIEELRGEQKSEHDKFYDLIDSVSLEKEKLLNISIYSEEDSFAYKNIVRTEKDYKRLAEVELSDINDYGVCEVLEFDIMKYIGLIAVLMTVFYMAETKKRGIDAIVHACCRGRFSLFFNRLILLCTVSLFVSAVLTTGTMTISFMNYGGADILFADVQSVHLLQGFTLHVSLLWFVAYYIVRMAAVYIVYGLCFWSVIHIVEGRSFAYIISGLIYIASYLMYNYIPEGCSFGILKYTNLCAPMELETYTRYYNFPFCGMLLNMREYVDVLLVSLIFIMSIVVIIAGCVIKPVREQSLFEKIFERMFIQIRRIGRYMGVFMHEAYKMLICWRGAVVGVLYVIVLLSWVDRVELILSPGRELLDEFYAEYTGEIDEDAMKVYETIESSMGGTVVSVNDAASAEEYMYATLSEQISRADILSERGIQGWFINDRGYKYLFGSDSIAKKIIEGIIASIAVIMMTAPIYVMEKQTGVYNYIRMAGEGPRKTGLAKTLYCVITGVLVSTYAIIIQLYDVMQRYELKGLLAPVQNVGILDGVAYNISIAGYMALWYSFRISCYVMSACAIMLISVLSRRIGWVYVLSLPMVGLGIACQMTGFLTNAPNIIVALLPMTVCVIISVVCIVFTLKVFNDNR